jgi:hypothetical protein
MRKPWLTKEWRAKRTEFLKGKSCQWCGSTKFLTVAHPIGRSASYEEYLSFNGIMALCRRCHFAQHKGLHLCPNCKKKYVRNHFDVCFDCLPLKRKKEIRKFLREEQEGDEEFEREKTINAFELNHLFCGNCGYSIRMEEELFCGLLPMAPCGYGFHVGDGVQRVIHIGN